MIYPSADKLEMWGSRYSLVVLAARRAKQLKGGALPMVDTDSRNCLTIALEEIAAGKIGCRHPDNDIIPTLTQEPEVAALLAIPAEERVDEAAEIAETEAGASAAVEEGLIAAISGLDEEEEEEIEEEEDELLPIYVDEEDSDEPVAAVDEDAVEEGDEKLPNADVDSDADAFPVDEAAEGQEAEE